jgi:hypothetical protein
VEYPRNEADRRVFRREALPGISAAAFRDTISGLPWAPSGDELGILLFFYYAEESSRRGKGDAGRMGDFFRQVARTDVRVEPGGRAILQDSEVTAAYSPRTRFAVGPDYRVEIAFQLVGRSKEPEPKQVRVIADQHLGWLNPPNLHRYYAALALALLREPEYEKLKSKAPTARPAAGHAPSLDFYRALLRRDRELRRAGDPAPARTIAEEQDSNPNTVRSWLKRARVYLEEER